MIVNTQNNPQSPSKFSLPTNNTTSFLHKSIKTQSDQSKTIVFHKRNKISLIHLMKGKRMGKIATQPSEKITISFGDEIQIKKADKLPQIKMQRKKNHLSFNQDKQLNTENICYDPYLSGKIRKQKQAKMNSLPQICAQKIFLQKVDQIQKDFLILCLYKKYRKAVQKLIILFNYSIDLNLIGQFCNSLSILGDLYLECNMLQDACFYFNEARKSYYDSGKNKHMIQMLIKLSIICVKAKLNQKAHLLLKKALQFAWFYGLNDLEINIYENMGKNYFLMGNSQKAKQYHMKYFSSGLQPNDSALKISSNQSLNLQGVKTRRIQSQINKLFLIKTSAPIMNKNQIPIFQSIFSINFRDQQYRDLKYFGIVNSVEIQINNILKQSMFAYSMGQLNIKSTDWTAPIRRRKFLSIDIQRNKHLQQLGYKIPSSLTNQNKAKKQTEFRSQVDQRIDIDKWCSNYVYQSQKSQYYLQSDMKNKVQMRGIQGHTKTKLSQLRTIYNKFYE